VAEDTQNEEPEAADDKQPAGRDEDLSRKVSIKRALIKLFNDVEEGFNNQNDRSNDQMDYWDIYNCQLGSHQFYDGTSQIFVPLVHNAINARVTRFINQMFPQAGRYVEVTTEDGTLPHALMSLAEHYVRKSKLRTEVMPAILRNGDVEGQYTLYVSWKERKRHVVRKVQKPAMSEDGIAIPGDEEIEDIVEGTIEEGYPEAEVIADADLCVLPATATSVEDAVDNGGSVTIIRRWSKNKIRKLMREGQINREAGAALIKAMNKKNESGPRYNKAKEAAWAAGIKSDGGKHAQIYETWTMLQVKGEQRLCKAFYGGEDNVLGCVVNPLWCDLVPILSVPIRKIAGSFKGLAPVKFCADMQYSANDAINMANDSTAYSLLPIVMTDPEKNPRVGTMVLAQAAIWETSPNDTKFAEFPKLWQDGLEVVSAATQQIATALSVNSAAITQQASRKKLNQAEIAQEQAVDLLSTADAVTVIEEGLLTPFLRLAIEMDHQYRGEAITIRQYGEMGVRAAMQEIPPIQMDNRYVFRWFGVEAARNAQQIQQQISGVNILRGIPPNMYPGYQLDLVPVMTQLVENLFGPRLAPLVFKDMKSQLSMDPDFENSMLAEGFDLPVHPSDDDAKHLQAHMQAKMQTGDLSGSIRTHMLRHQMSMQMKTQQAMAQQQGAQPGAPKQAGVANAPRMGAQPRGPRNGQAPPGAIHPDQMIDPRRAPQ
jgi:hypothetical protein